MLYELLLGFLPFLYSRLWSTTNSSTGVERRDVCFNKLPGGFIHTKGLNNHLFGPAIWCLVWLKVFAHLAYVVLQLLRTQLWDAPIIVY